MMLKKIMACENHTKHKYYVVTRRVPAVMLQKVVMYLPCGFKGLRIDNEIAERRGQFNYHFSFIFWWPRFQY